MTNNISDRRHGCSAPFRFWNLHVSTCYLFRPGLAKMSSAASSLKRGRAIDIDFDAGEKTILSADALKVADAVCYVVLF